MSPVQRYVVAWSVAFCTVSPTMSATAQDSAAAPARAAIHYIPVKASDFPAQRLSLVGKYVELSGDFHTPTFIDNFIPGQFREDGRVVAEVVFDKIQPEARQWIVKNMCRMTCNGVFVRGQVVFRPNSPAPVLEMTDISIESKAGAQAGGSDVGAAIAAKDRLGGAKAVLPPHTIPTTSAWPDWTGVAPRSSGYDSTRSMRTNVETHADELNRAEYENERLIMRGPERPTDFQTSRLPIAASGIPDCGCYSSNSPLSRAEERFGLASRS